LAARVCALACAAGPTCFALLIAGPRSASGGRTAPGAALAGVVQLARCCAEQQQHGLVLALYEAARTEFGRAQLPAPLGLLALRSALLLDGPGGAGDLDLAGPEDVRAVVPDLGERCGTVPGAGAWGGAWAL
jgi:hypothetical protein